MSSQNNVPKILTNMTFWQSREWLERVDSIYELTFKGGNPDFMPWWKEVWSLFKKRKEYDIILTMGVRESFGFAALCWLFRYRCCHVMTEIFIDSPRHLNPIWRLKTNCYRFLAKRAAGIITNSSEETRTNAYRYRIPENIFRYVPLATTIGRPELIDSNDGYYLCAGRTLRDYKTLWKVISMTQHSWVIVAGRHDMEDLNLPDRVTVYREINRDAYLDLLRKAAIVVLPLLTTERATGQVVALEAMSYGKPVITTDAPGTRDIVRDGENGFLVSAGNAAEIIDKIGELERDPALTDRLGRTALQDIQTTFSTDTHARNRLAAIELFWSRWSGS